MSNREHAPHPYHSVDSLVVAIEAGVGDREKRRHSPLRAVTQRVYNALPPSLTEHHTNGFVPATLIAEQAALERKLGNPPYVSLHQNEQTQQVEFRSRLPKEFLAALRRDDPSIQKDYIDAYAALVSARLVGAGLTDRLAKSQKKKGQLHSEQLAHTRSLKPNEMIDGMVQHWGRPVQPRQVGTSLYEAHRQLALAGDTSIPYWVFRPPAATHRSQLVTSEHVDRFQSDCMPPQVARLEDITAGASPCSPPPSPGASLEGSPQKSKHTLQPSWIVTEGDATKRSVVETPMSDALVVAGAQSAALLLSEHALKKDVIVVGKEGLWYAFCAQSVQYNLAETAQHTASLFGQTITVTAEKMPDIFDVSDMRAAQLMHASMQLWGTDIYSVPTEMNLTQLRKKISHMESAA